MFQSDEMSETKSQSFGKKCDLGTRCNGFCAPGIFFTIFLFVSGARHDNLVGLNHHKRQ